MEWLKYREKLPNRLNLRTRPWEKSNPINEGVCKTDHTQQITNSGNGDCLFETIAYFSEISKYKHIVTKEVIDKCIKYAMTEKAVNKIRKSLGDIYNKLSKTPNEKLSFWGNQTFKQVMFELYIDNTIREHFGYEKIKKKDININGNNLNFNVFIKRYISSLLIGLYPNYSELWGNLRDLQCLSFHLNYNLCLVKIDRDRLSQNIRELHHYNCPGSNKTIRVLNWEKNSNLYFAACNWNENIPIQIDGTPEDVEVVEDEKKDAINLVSEHSLDKQKTEPKLIECKKFKKTKSPKCEEQENCKWIKGKGCIKHVEQNINPNTKITNNCKKYKKTKSPKCEEQENCEWIKKKGCVNKIAKGKEDKDMGNDKNNDKINDKIEKEVKGIKIIEKVKKTINKNNCKTNLSFHVTNNADGNCLFETIAYFKETLRARSHELSTGNIEKCRRYAMTTQASNKIREQLYEIYNEMLVNPEEIIPFWGNVRFNQVMFELFNDNTLRNDLGYREIRDEDIGTTKIEDEWKIHSCSFINKYISNTKNGVLPNGKVFWGNLRDLQCIAYNLNLKLCVIGIDTDSLEKKIVSLQHYDRPGSKKTIRVLNWAGVHFAACNWDRNIPIQRDSDIVPEPNPEPSPSSEPEPKPSPNTSPEPSPKKKSQDSSSDTSPESNTTPITGSSVIFEPDSSEKDSDNIVIIGKDELMTNKIVEINKKLLESKYWQPKNIETGSLVRYKNSRMKSPQIGIVRVGWSGNVDDPNRKKNI